MPLRALLYCRSSFDRWGTVRSVAEQEAECRAERVRRGWSVVEVVIDSDRGVLRFSRRSRDGWDPLLIGHDITEDPTGLDVSVVSVDTFVDSSAFADCQAITMVQGLALTVEEATVDLSGSSIRGRVTNPGSDVVKTAYIDCVLRAGSQIVGGESTALLDPIAPGATIAFQISAFYLPELVDAAECQVIA